MLPRIFILLAFAAFGDLSPTMPVYDTIIVGMGAAGCTAASVLCKAGRRVLALEAQNRVGGRVHTVPFGEGVVEMGAEWIHGERDSRVCELAAQNNITLIPQDVSFQVFRSDGTNADSELVNELMNYTLDLIDQPPKDPEPLGQYLTRRLMEYITTNRPELLSDTDFIQQLLHFLDLVINNYEATNSWNDLTTHTKYEDLEGNLHLSWHRYGYKTLFEILLNTYKGGPGYPTLNIQYEKVVTRITYPQDPAEDVEVTCKDGSSYKARNVIVTVSLGVLKERYTSLFYPPLPDEKAAIIDTISIGVVDKIILLFDHAWWRKDLTVYGFIWREEEKIILTPEDEWVYTIFGASSPKGSEKALTLWTCGRMAKMVETLPEDVVKRKSMELIRRFMGKDKTIPEPTDMLRSTWYLNPYTRGSYTYDNLQTPLHPNAREILAEPLVDSSEAPRVLFAGEATDTIHFSTVHGAMDTGHREASRLLPKGKL